MPDAHHRLRHFNTDESKLVIAVSTPPISEMKLSHLSYKYWSHMIEFLDAAAWQG